MIDKIKNIVKMILGRIRLFGKKPRHGIRIGELTFVLKECKMVQMHSNGRFASAQIIPSTAWKKAAGDLIIDPNKEPNPHIVIVGMSGFGKSTLFRSMLSDINGMGIPAIVFDAHNEHEGAVRHLNGRVYDSNYYGINLLELNGLSKQQRISEIVSLLKGVYALGHIQATKLGQCLHYTYRKAEANGAPKPPTMQDLLHELSIFIRNSRSASETNSLLHLKEKLSLLSGSAFGRGQISIDSLQRGVSSFSLAGLKNPESRIIYIHELLRRIYLSMKQNQKERGLRLFIMVDEAQFLLGAQKGSGAIRSMVEEGRKYGAGVVIATHISSNLDRQVLANASTLISFYPRDPSEINYMSNAMSGGEPRTRELVRSKLRRLRQNEAMVVSGLMRNPMVVRTRSASEMGELNAGNQANMPDLSKPSGYDELVSSVGKEGTDMMLHDGVISGETVDAAGSKVQMVMKKSNKSIEHELEVSRISKRLSDIGIKHYIMNNSRGPDIVAYIDGTKVAIEYETGRKNPASTEKMLASRATSFARTIVFVNAAALHAYREKIKASNAEMLDIGALASYDFCSAGQRPPPQIGI